jgi:beta-galactosidase
MPDLQGAETEGELILQGADVKVTWNKSEGTIASFRAHGRELLVAGPRECYYRAPTDIDLLMGNAGANALKWREAGLDRLERSVLSFQVARANRHLVTVRVHSRLCAPDRSDGIDSEVACRVYGNGEIVFDNAVLVSDRLPFLPRVGLELALPDDLEQIAWYGRGPHENYVDRKQGAAVGLYTSTVDEQFTPYVYPTECGGREDVRWIALTGKDGTGLMVTGVDMLHTSALRYTVADLARARHPHELTARDHVVLHLDGRHMGLGGDTGWTANVHPEYLIQPGRYRYSLRLRAVSADDDLPSLARSTIEGVL